MRIRPKPPKNGDNDDKKPKKIQNHDSGKDFKLKKKEEINAEGLQSQQQQQMRQAEGIQESGKVAMRTVESIKQIDNVKLVILRMVDSMEIGKSGETSLLNATLKNDASIHESLRLATVKLEMTTEGLKVQIDPVDGQKDMAESLIAQHHDQVAQLQQTLAAKNINLLQLQVGDHIVELPQQRLLTPRELFSGQQKDSGSRDRKKEGPPKRIDPTEK